VLTVLHSTCAIQSKPPRQVVGEVVATTPFSWLVAEQMQSVQLRLSTPTFSAVLFDQQNLADRQIRLVPAQPWRFIRRCHN